MRNRALSSILFVLVTLCCFGVEPTIEVLPGLSPQASIANLLKTAEEKSLTAEGHFNLALAYFANRQFGEAVVVGKLGLGTTKNSEEKAALHLVIAQAYGALGDYENAARTALEGQRLNPRSRELAALRFGYFEVLGEKAQVLSAKDHLRRLDPNFGEPVMTWEEGRVIAIKTTAVIYLVYKEVWPRIQDLIKTVQTTWPKAVVKASR